MHVAQAEQRDLCACRSMREILDDFRLADFDELRLLLDRHAFGRAARITDEGRMPSVRGGEHHVHQFVFVLRRHGDDVRHATQIGDVE